MNFTEDLMIYEKNNLLYFCIIVFREVLLISIIHTRFIIPFILYFTHKILNIN